MHNNVEFNLFGHTKVSPTYYIDDVKKCQDEYALFIYNKIFERVEKILTSRCVIDYYKNTNIEIAGFYSINKGHCEDIAAFVYEEIKESEYDTSRTRVLTLIDENSKSYNNTQHTWIEYTTSNKDTYHFDSSVPWGVKNIMHIPLLYSFPWVLTFSSSIQEVKPYQDIPNQIAGIYGYKNDIKSKNIPFIFK
jgi:hypothetical protein